MQTARLFIISLEQDQAIFTLEQGQVCGGPVAHPYPKFQ